MPRVNDADVLARLHELGLELPAPPPAIAAYVPVVVHGSTASVAGQVAMIDGAVLHPGVVGDGVSMDEARQAAARAVLQAVSALRAELGSLERLERIVKLDVFVAATPRFTDHPQVANAASELLVELLGEPGRHARAAVGVSSLPLGASVEIVVTAAVAPR
jgi:enamine deaminase RidA (YjgF/YER057c/UK114 family)